MAGTVQVAAQRTDGPQRGWDLAPLHRAPPSPGGEGEGRGEAAVKVSCCIAGEGDGGWAACLVSDRGGQQASAPVGHPHRGTPCPGRSRPVTHAVVWPHV